MRHLHCVLPHVWKIDDASKLPPKMMGGVGLRFLYCVAKSTHCAVLSVLTHDLMWTNMCLLGTVHVKMC